MYQHGFYTYSYTCTPAQTHVPHISKNTQLHIYACILHTCKYANKHIHVCTLYTKANTPIYTYTNVHHIHMHIKKKKKKT